MVSSVDDLNGGVLNGISRSKSVRIQGVEHLFETHREPVRLLLHFLANLVTAEADECIL